ncbi:hypothetical protein MG5_04674 [Candida albicans P57072]|nr:hypothetical protein MEO_04610 [Candida albicans P94015]KGQ88428.1 hypothetical protein MG1_04682 [Candida albicans GC75]KGR04937.1 hypothetical protein MG5_04674 [Candida albicans P57072]KGR11039.1 hypothetical protein MG9_04665 [Candida albicans P37037]KGU04783.1 hypothetical protein MEQ_04640 [Candida albicans P87]KGU25079.1 hypothetical protein MGM_04685 [Candida albicans P75063]KHC31757.1 hypothetical protein MGQ_04653 [Candida albicans P76067]KHC33794.1 hypothetical protein W5O_0470
MKIITWLLYLIKINIVQIILNNSRNPSISLQYIHSSIFDHTPSKCTGDTLKEDIYSAERVWMNNITDIPVVSNEDCM